MELSLSLESVTTANVKPSAKHENGSSLDCIPLNDTFPHLSLRSATCSREISNCLQLILNNEYDHLSLSPSLQQSTWGTGRDLRGLQAKHKIEDKLELIICLLLYMCFKIKCKLYKVITELEREKKKLSFCKLLTLQFHYLSPPWMWFANVLSLCRHVKMSSGRAKNE